MENAISEPIETTSPTNNEGEEEEEDIIPVKLVDEEERFKERFKDREPVLYESKPRLMKSQRAEPVKVLCDYKQEGQVIVQIKTRTKELHNCKCELANEHRKVFHCNDKIK